MTKWVFRNSGTNARRNVLSMALATSLIVGTSATAQEQHTGTLVPGRAGSSMVQESGRLRASDRPQNASKAAAIRATNEAQETLRRFAGCLVSGAGTQREKRELVAFLKTAPDDPALRARSNKIMRENCLYGTGGDSVLLRFDPGLLRGAIFRELYLDYGRKIPAPIARDDVASSWSANAGAMVVANQRFGDCIVTADQQAADSFVRAKVASAQQNAALNALVGRMSGCLTQGLTLQMSRGVLDGLLGEALYRKASASTNDLAQDK